MKIVDTIQGISSVVVAGCFVMSMYKRDELKPREYWLKAVLADIIVRVVVGIVGLAVVWMSGAAEASCLSIADA